VTDSPDLTLVSTDDLIDEIFRRNDAVLVARTTKRTNEQSRYAFSYCGSVLAAIGLCEQTKYELLQLNRPLVNDGTET
jgi:hypothetical protein